MSKRKLNHQPGQGLVEYAIIISLVAAVLMLSLSLLGFSLKDVYYGIVNTLRGGAGPASYYMNDFDGDLTDWTTHNWWFLRGGWATKDGRLIGDRAAATFLDDFSGDDYVVSLNDVNVNNVKKHWNGFAVLFRTDTEGRRPSGYSFEYEQISRHHPGELYFSKWANGVQIRPPIARVKAPPGFDPINPGDVKIAVQGDTFTAYINEEQVLQASDSTYSEGGVGLITNWGSSMSLDSVSIDPVP
jgi:Flp pilus assembly pilin Flp